MQILPAYDPVLILFCKDPQYRDRLFGDIQESFDFQFESDSNITVKGNVQKLTGISPSTHGKWHLSVAQNDTQRTLEPVLQAFFKNSGRVKMGTLVPTKNGHTTQYKFLAGPFTSFKWLEKLWIGQDGGPITEVCMWK